MTCRSAAQVYDCTSDIFRHTQSAVRVQLRHCFFTTLELHQAGCHFGREKAGSDAIAEDVARTEFDGEVAGKVDSGSYSG